MKALTLENTIIHCDACGHEFPGSAEVWHGKPCPRCGAADIVDDADIAPYRELVHGADRINEAPGAVPPRHVATVHFDSAAVKQGRAWTDVIEEVKAELARAMEKFPVWPTDPLHALAVLGEEYGELTQAMLQRTYEPEKSTAEDVRMEAIQTAAMALRLAMSLDCYEYRRCDQHTLDRI